MGKRTWDQGLLWSRLQPESPVPTTRAPGATWRLCGLQSRSSRSLVIKVYLSTGKITPIKMDKGLEQTFEMKHKCPIKR